MKDRPSPARPQTAPTASPPGCPAPPPDHSEHPTPGGLAYSRAAELSDRAAIVVGMTAAATRPPFADASPAEIRATLIPEEQLDLRRVDVLDVLWAG